MKRQWVTTMIVSNDALSHRHTPIKAHTNIKPTDYKWVRSSSVYDLCHKGKNNEESKQAVLWLVGEVDNHTLTQRRTPPGR